MIYSLLFIYITLCILAYMGKRQDYTGFHRIYYRCVAVL